jgi:hypothetical protein
VGSTVSIRFPRRSLDIAIDALPQKSTSRKAARELYRVVGDEPAGTS